MSRKEIYFDHAATTPVDEEVLAQMLPYFTTYYGNPSSIYRLARESRKGLETAREQVAEVLNCVPKEIIFTSGATESINTALKGIAWQSQLQNRGADIISTPVEHHAALHTLDYLKKFGFTVTFLPVDQYGRVDPADVERAITPRTCLINVMYANNEIGTIEPIAAIGEIARAHKIPFHTDAVQAAGALALDVKELKVDLLSLSSHKFYGPKGIGILYVRGGTPLLYQQQGGSQERKRRAGTENLPLIVGTGAALVLAEKRRITDNTEIAQLRDKLIDALLSPGRFAVPVRLNGHPTERLANNVNVCFDYMEGETVLLNLDLHGIYASSGSACTSASTEPSHVLSAIGIPAEIAHGSIRFTLGRRNTNEEVETLLELLPDIIKKLSALSPMGAGRRVD